MILDQKVFDAIKSAIPEVEEKEFDLLAYIQSICTKVDYDREKGIITVADKCDVIVGALDALSYNCDNCFFGGKPNKADGLMIYYNLKDKDNKGYLIINKEVAERMLT